MADSRHLEEDPKDSEYNVWIRNKNQDIALRGIVDNGDPTSRRLIMKQQPDGTMRSFALHVVTDPDGRERVALAEADATPRSQIVLWDGTDPVRWQVESANGEAKIMLYGDDGAAPIALAAETTGELMASLKAEDPSNALVGPLTDDQRMLRMRGFEPWRWAAPVAITPGGGYQTIVTAPASTGVIIEYTIGTSAGVPLVDVHIVPNAGAPGVANAVVTGASPTVGAVPFRDGPYVLEPGGSLRARNTAAAGNTANIIPWVEYYSTGDTV